MRTEIVHLAKPLQMRFLLGIMLVFSVGLIPRLYGQNNLYSKAHKLYFEGKYEQAIPVYEKALRRGVHPLSTERLADCYRETGNSKKAEKWYQKAIKSGRNNSSTQLNYGRMLHSNGKYDEAADQYEAYMNETRDYPAVANDFRSCKLALYLMRQPSPYSISQIKQLNTVGSELVGANLDKELIFATTGKHGSLDKPQKSTKRNKDYDLVSAEKKRNKKFITLNKIKGKANTSADEFAPSFSRSGDSVLFTRTTIVKQGRNKLPLKIHRIYMSTVKDGKWSKAESVPFNGPGSVSNFHPAFHPRGGWVVFASDRKGGMGGSDLWRTKVGKGKWGKPENLGFELNTTGDEMWPCIAPNGALSFASNGHPGLGGLDLFTADWSKGDWKNPQNMGAGINTSKNETALVWNRGGASGYFSSARKFERQDDIYFFEKLPTIDGIIRDSLSMHIKPGVKLILSDGRSGEQETETDKEGAFTFFGEIGKTYQLKLEAPGYKTISRRIKVDSMNLKDDHFIELRIPPRMVYTLEGNVADSETEDGLPNVRIELVPKGRGVKRIYSADASGKYSFRIVTPGEYQVVYNREGYNPQTIDLSLTDQSGPVTQNFDISMDWDRQTPVASAIRGNSIREVPWDGEAIRVNPDGEIRDNGQSRTLYFTGKVFAKESGSQTLGASRVDVMNLTTHKVLGTSETRADGSFDLTVPRRKGAVYYIVASKEGYFSSGEMLQSAKGSQFEVNLGMDEVSYGLDSTLVNIFYGYNNSELDLPTQGALCELGLFMLENPEAILEIWSFTDSRGGRSYNRKLSQRRSESVIGYIGNQLNVPRKRFNARGFGEDQLLNDCTDGKPCSEADHNVNRRTEIKVVN